ncbi:MAG: DUF4834 family protein [Prolixibacteraceae bacterium]|nr:DUF4834 family protein [Prolixibacteraceae bacterium]
MGFIRTLLFILFIYFVVRFIIRLLLPNNNKQTRGNTTEKPEGETTVRFNKKGEKIIDKDEGEYVDFEEVD